MFALSIRVGKADGPARAFRRRAEGRDGTLAAMQQRIWSALFAQKVGGALDSVALAHRAEMQFDHRSRKPDRLRLLIQHNILPAALPRKGRNLLRIRRRYPRPLRQPAPEEA